jgi:hypothetical protein
MTASINKPASDWTALDEAGAEIGRKALRALVNAKRDWFVAASEADRERVLTALRGQAPAAIQELLDDTAAAPWIADAAIASAIASLVLAGSREIRTIETGRA